MPNINNDVLLEGDNLRSYTAGAAIEAGAVVKITDDNTVQAADTDGEAAIGVALYDVASGEAVAVARDGTKVRAVDGAGDVSAGDDVTPDTSNNDGELAQAGNGDRVLGTAITAGGSSGDVIEVEIDLQGIVQTA